MRVTATSLVLARWVYQPAIVEGRPVPVMMTTCMTVTTIRFETCCKGR